MVTRMPKYAAKADSMSQRDFTAHSVSQMWILKAVGFRRCAYCDRMSLGPCDHGQQAKATP